MDHARAKDTQDKHYECDHQSSLMPRYRDHCDESDNRPIDSTALPSENSKRAFRRVRSPSRPRAWLSRSYKPKFGIGVNKPCFSREDGSFHKTNFSTQRYNYLKSRYKVHPRDHFQPKPQHIVLKKERPRDERKNKERYEEREGYDGCLPSKQSNTSRPFLPRSTSNRDKDTQFTISQSDMNQSKERDHRASKSKDRERSRDGELPLTACQTAARDRAIQQKRREIDEVYYQECEMFGLVAKMLIAKDPSLEHPIQSSLQENLRDIGKRCVEAMEQFIKDYDSRDLLH